MTSCLLTILLGAYPSPNQPCGRDSENIIGVFLKSFSIITILGAFKISTFLEVSVAKQTGLHHSCLQVVSFIK